MWFPSRNRFPNDLAVSDRQLWAIGMAVVQWGMTEFIIDMQVGELVGNDENLKAERKMLRRFRDTVDFWQRLAERKLDEPKRSLAGDFATRIKNLNDQRDKIVHKLWGGGCRKGHG